MKTTLDLDDALLTEAKAAALRRELMPAVEAANPNPDKFEKGPLGFLVLRRKPGDTITLSAIRAVQAELDDTEFQRAVAPRRQ